MLQFGNCGDHEFWESPVQKKSLTRSLVSLRRTNKTFFDAAIHAFNCWRWSASCTHSMINQTSNHLLHKFRFVEPMNILLFFKQIGHSRPLFLYFCLFNKQLTVDNCSIKVANDWIRTRVFAVNFAITTALKVLLLFEAFADPSKNHCIDRMERYNKNKFLNTQQFKIFFNFWRVLIKA